MSEKLGLLALLPDETSLHGGEDVFSANSRALRRRGAPNRRRAHTDVIACYARSERLDALAETLLERETLDEVDAYAAAGSAA